MAWSDEPTNWGKPGHANRGWEYEEVLRRIRAMSNLAHVVFTAASASDTTTSASFDDITNYTQAFTKYMDETSLEIIMLCSAFSTSASTEMNLGVRINGVDYTAGNGFFFNAANTHASLAGAVKIAGGVVPAGGYTALGRWLRAAGAGTLSFGSGDDYQVMIIRECFS